MVVGGPAPIDDAAGVPGQRSPGDRTAGRCRHDLRYTWACVRADWADPTTGPIGKLALLVQRVGHLIDAGHLPVPMRGVLWPLYRLVDTVWVKLLVGADLHHTCCIGPGLRLAHGGRGVVLAPGVVIGSDVAVYHQVTLGTTETRPNVWPLPVPVIGDQARVGTGARVLGDVHVGAGSVIGANAVVLADVPEGTSVPAASRWR